MATFPNMSLGEGLIRPYELLETLISDFNKALELLHPDKESQFLRRVLVRNAFSFIEGIVQILKFELKTDFRLGHTGYQLTENERELLYEERLEEEKKTSIFISVEKNIFKTFKLAAKIWDPNGGPLHIEYDEKRIILTAKNTRNKLTHPRTYYDLEISDYEVVTIIKAFDFVTKLFQQVMERHVNALKAKPISILEG